MFTDKILSIYGARPSKNGQFVNIVLCEGEKDNRTFYHACVKCDELKKIRAEISDGNAIITIPLLTRSYAKPIEGQDVIEDLPF